MFTIAEQKKGLRREVRQLKATFTPTELEDKSLSAVASILQNSYFKAAQCVMLYYPLPDEVDLRPLIEQCIDSKQIILPTVVGDDIVPVPLTASKQLKKGAFNILEPEDQPYLGSFDLIVVPGMAFDGQGNRLGRGKGFYDRFLAKHPDVPTLGVCFDFQRVPHIPTEPFDKPVTQLITTS